MERNEMGKFKNIEEYDLFDGLEEILTAEEERELLIKEFEYNKTLIPANRINDEELREYQEKYWNGIKEYCEKGYRKAFVQFNNYDWLGINTGYIVVDKNDNVVKEIYL